MHKALAGAVIAAAVTLLSTTAATTAPLTPGAIQAGSQVTAPQIQPVHFRRWRHCRWWGGVRRCHGDGYGYYRPYRYGYGYGPGIYLRFGGGHWGHRRRHWR
jgi:hypothetical protein